MSQELIRIVDNIARDKNIVIHTIAMGDPASTGEEKFDEETLKNIAEITKGEYFRANDRKELEGVYGELDRLTPHQVETISHRPVTDLFYWPLAAGLVVIMGFCLVQAIGKRYF